MGSVNSSIYVSAPCIASHEKVTLPIFSSSVPSSGVSNLKQGTGVSVGVSVGVFVGEGFSSTGAESFFGSGEGVSVAVGMGVGVASVSILQAARTNPQRDVQLSFRKSLREMGGFFMGVFSFRDRTDVKVPC